MNSNRPVVLLSPPPSDPTHPYSSLPMLTGFLRHHDCCVIQKDLGIRLFDEFMTADELEKATKRAISRKDGESDPNFAERFFRIIGLSGYIIEHVEEAKRVMRSADDFYDLEDYDWASSILKLACDLVSLPHHPTFLTPYDCTMRVGYAFKDLLDATSDRSYNLFFDSFDSDIVPEILSYDPILVGISVTYGYQIVPAFTLSRLLKKVAPKLHISIGGAVISEMESQLMKDATCFQFADSYVLGEGESAILTIATSLQSGQDLKSAPNTIIEDNGRPYAGKMWTYEDFKNMPPPDFDGLELERYLSPEPVFLVSSSRGCYYGKCAFCNVSMNTKQKHRTLNRGQTASLIKDLFAKYGTKRFILGDDAVPIANMMEIAHLVLNELPFITWSGEARFERNLSDEMIATLKKGGCRELTFGLESASQRVLDLMNKRNSVDDDMRILGACSEAGIAVNTQTFIGFPSETTEEAWRTINFVIDNERSLFSYGFGTFQLLNNTPVYNCPEKFGITIIPNVDEGSLIAEYNFEQSLGMTRQEVNKLNNQALSRLEKVYHGRTNYLCRFGGAHILLHLSRYGCDEMYEIWKRNRENYLNEIAFGYDSILHVPSHIMVSHPFDSDHFFKHRALNTKTGKQYDLLPSEQRVLELCDGTNNVMDVIGIWSKEYGNAEERTLNLANCLIPMMELYRNGLIIGG